MEVEQSRTYSRFEIEDGGEARENYYKITNRISFKAPEVERTIQTWKPARTRKRFRERCTRTETGGFCMTNIGIVTVSVLFCYCIPPNLFTSEEEAGIPQKITDNFWRMLVFISGLMMSSMSLLFLWLTYVTDPGVITPERELQFRMLQPGERICKSCKIIKPPKGKHCKYCDHCVEVFDHHCPYAGTCVGNGNYLFFCLLLLSGLCSSIYTVVFSIWFLKENWPVREQWKGLKAQLIVGLMLTILCSLIGILIGHLCGYHVFIAVKGQTTNEWILKKRSTRRTKQASNDDTPSKEPLLGNRQSQEPYSHTIEAKESYTVTTTEDTSWADSRFADL